MGLGIGLTKDRMDMDIHDKICLFSAFMMEYGEGSRLSESDIVTLLR